MLKWGWKEGGSLGTSSSVFGPGIALLSRLPPGGGGGFWLTPQVCLFAFLFGRLCLACGGSLGLTSGPSFCGSVATAHPASLGL